MERYKITSSEFIELLKTLLKEGVVEEVISAKEKKNPYTLTPIFVSKPEDLDDFPLSRLFVYGYARTDSAAVYMLKTKESLEKKVAVIGRPCDIRGLIELDKKLQVKWENLFTIAFEDVGYIENKVISKFFKLKKYDPAKITSERLTHDSIVFTFDDGKKEVFELGKEINIAEPCTRCIRKTHAMADFLISTYGLGKDSEEYIITPQSDRARGLIKKMGWEDKKIDDNLNESYEKEKNLLFEQCEVKRKKVLKEWAETPGSKKLEILAKCTGCGQCVNACAVCYCVTCNLLDQVRAKTMEKLNFVMNRFAHVGDTCVECGRCESNCPVNIPLAVVFSTLVEKFKERNGYEAGIDLNTKVMHINVR